MSVRPSTPRHKTPDSLQVILVGIVEAVAVRLPRSAAVAGLQEQVVGADVRAGRLHDGRGLVDHQALCHGDEYLLGNIVLHRENVREVAVIGGRPHVEAVADLADRYSYGEIRATHEQNLVLPYVKKTDLPDLWRDLQGHGLATANGLDMLLHQAVRGFELWFGVRPEVDSATRAAALR